MPWRVMRPDLIGSERDDLAGCVERVDGRLWLDAKSEQQPAFDDAVVQKKVVAMQVHRHTKGFFCGRNACHVVDVRVRQQDVANRQPVALDEGEESLNLIARIDEDRVARLFAGDHEAVLEKRTNCLGFENHRAYDNGLWRPTSAARERKDRGWCAEWGRIRGKMILAVLDDLMFTSKIKSAATHAGVALLFARSSDAALSEMRKKLPSLVIFDLNNPRTDPLGTVGAMKQDPALASVPTVGFVSHVDTNTIEAARRAGVDEVLARSSFVTRLAEILARDQKP